MSMDSLVLWDLDLTLANCGPAPRQAVVRAAQAAVDGSSAAANQVAPDVPMAGRTDLAILTDLLASAGLDADECAKRLPAAVVHLELEMAAIAADIAEVGRPLPGVPDVLDRVARSGAALQTVLTGNIRPNARLKLAVLGLDDWFDLDVGAFGDDDADRIELLPIARERATAKYGREWTGEATWIVGDSAGDYACAAAGGARCLLVATGRALFHELAALGADAVVHDLSDVDRVVDLLLGADSLERHTP